MVWAAAGLVDTVRCPQEFVAADNRVRSPRWRMQKRYTEEQIIGFLREADAGMTVKDLCRKHGFSELSYYAWKAKFGESVGCPAVEDARIGEHQAQEAARALDARDRRDA